jgi:hypothetical protein
MQKNCLWPTVCSLPAIRISLQSLFAVCNRQNCTNLHIPPLGDDILKIVMSHTEFGQQSESDVHVTVHRDKFLIIEPTRCTNFSKFYFWMKLYVFQTVPLSIIRSFSLYTQQWYMSHRFADSLWAGAYAPVHRLSANLCDIYHCCAYSEKLLMMDRGTVRNM